MKHWFVLFFVLSAACEPGPVEPAETGPYKVYVEGEACVPLVIKEVIPVGRVCLSIYKDILRVTFTTEDRWRFDAAHFWMDFGLEKIPVNRAGAPIFEWFPFVDEPWNSVNELVLVVPLEEYGFDAREDLCMPQGMYMMAHARVFRSLAGGRYQWMEAFAQGPRLREIGAPAMYFKRVLNCGRNPDTSPW
jgi:hypothetical protein